MMSMWASLVLLLSLSADALVTTNGWVRAPRQQQITTRELFGKAEAAANMLEDPVVVGVGMGAAAVAAASRMFGGGKGSAPSEKEDEASGAVSANDFLLQVAAQRASSSSKMEVAADKIKAAAAELVEEGMTANEFLYQVAASRAESASKMYLSPEEMTQVIEELTANSFLLEVAASRTGSASKMPIA